MDLNEIIKQLAEIRRKVACLRIRISSPKLILNAPGRIKQEPDGLDYEKQSVVEDLPVTEKKKVVPEAAAPGHRTLPDTEKKIIPTAAGGIPKPVRVRQFKQDFFQRPYRRVKVDKKKEQARWEADCRRRAHGVAKIIVDLGDLVNPPRPKNSRDFNHFRRPLDNYQLPPRNNKIWYNSRQQNHTTHPHYGQRRPFNNYVRNKYYNHRAQNYYREQY